MSDESLRIYISRDGGQFGPYSFEQTKSYIESGDLRANDLAWHEGASHWLPLDQIVGPNFVASSPSVTGPEQEPQSDWVPPRRTGILSAIPVPVKLSGDVSVAQGVVSRETSFLLDDQPRQRASNSARNEHRRRQTRAWGSYGRPTSITIIGWTLGFLGVCAVAETLMMISMSDDPRIQEGIKNSPIQFGVDVGMMGISAIVNFGIGVNVMRGEIWARWLYVIFFAVLLAFGLINGLVVHPAVMVHPDTSGNMPPATAEATAHILVLLPGILLQGTIILFLFLPKAYDYFSGR